MTFHLMTTVAALAFVMTFASAQATETWKKDRYGYETWRSDKGEVWKKDRYGYETWRSNKGTTCKQDRFGGAVRCR